MNRFDGSGAVDGRGSLRKGDRYYAVSVVFRI